MPRLTLPLRFAIAAALLLVALPAAAAVQAENLRCEYRVDPLGLDARRPRLSWTLHSGERGQIQTAYQLLVASSAETLRHGRGDRWDSGKVSSGDSIQVEYG